MVDPYKIICNRLNFFIEIQPILFEKYPDGKTFIYFPVTLSNRFIMEKINMADTMQQRKKTPQSKYKSMRPHSKLPMNNSLLPTAVANNHPPCIKP